MKETDIDVLMVWSGYYSNKHKLTSKWLLVLSSKICPNKVMI